MLKHLLMADPPIPATNASLKLQKGLWRAEVVSSKAAIAAEMPLKFKDNYSCFSNKF